MLRCAVVPVKPERHCLSRPYKRFAPSGRPFGAVRDLRKLCGDEWFLDEALQTVVLMDQQGIPIPCDTIYCLLESCTKRKDLSIARQVRSIMVRRGLDSNAYLADYLIRLFTLCESLSEAKEAFHAVANPSMYTWHAIISAHAKLGESDRALDLYQEMQLKGINPGKFIFLSILKACSNMKALGQGRLIHDQILRCEFQFDLSIGNTLVDMYTKCGSLEEACNVFDRLQKPDVVSCGAMIAGYAAHGFGVQAFELFKKMQLEGLKPNVVIFVCTLQASGSIGELGQGQFLHDQIIRNGFQSDAMVGSALVDMYAKCGSLEDACKVFNKFPNRDVVLWGALIAGYAQHGQGLAALALYKQMKLEGVKPSRVTFLCILKACGSVGIVGQGRMIHDEIIANKFGSDIIVGNALIDMYIKCGSLEEACKVFDELPRRDVVSWNAIISGYAQHGLSLSAFKHFIKMEKEGIKAGKVTFLSILKACCSIGAIRQGRHVHDEITRRGFELDVSIRSALVDTYAKCGSMKEAYKLFATMHDRDVALWGTIIAGYAQYGDCRLTQQCLMDMQFQGLKPDGWIYSSILAACSHAGYVEEGRWYFKAMTQDHGIKPSIEHFNCMIDLFGRAGRLKEARNVLQTMPLEPDVTGWTSLLACCKMYGNKELGRECFHEAIRLDPNNAASFVLMSSVYADANMWEDVQRIQELQKYAGVWKKPGRAWIELNDRVHEFIMGDETHLESRKLTSKSRRLKRQLEDEGYVPQLEVASNPMSDVVNGLPGPFVEQAVVSGLF